MVVDNKNAFEALLTDLPKAFDCVNDKLFIEKRHAYGLDFTSLKPIHNYFNKQKQKVRIKNSFSTVLELKHGVPQGSILGPIFFNIHIFNLLCFIETWETAANYAEDTLLYTTSMTITDAISSLEVCSKILFKWYDGNYMKANSDKIHRLLSSASDVGSAVNINGNIISNIKSERLLGVTTDYKLYCISYFIKLVQKKENREKYLHNDFKI